LTPSKFLKPVEGREKGREEGSAESVSYCGIKHYADEFYT